MSRSLLFVICPLIYTSLVSLAAGQGLQPVIFTLEVGSEASAFMSPFFGQSEGQGPNGEGETSPLVGHFLVEFDPLDVTPDSIEFQLGHGFVDAQVTGNWVPGFDVDSDFNQASVAEPADFGIEAQSFLFGNLTMAVRDQVWDWSSAPIANSGSNTFVSNTTAIHLLSQSTDFYTTTLGSYSVVSSGDSFSLTGGSWNLSQSGDTWTLAGALTYKGVEVGTAPIEWTIDILATAEFSAANVDAVVPDAGTGNAVASVLGGAGGAQPGGVSVAFEGVAADATFAAQELPDQISFSQQAIEAIDSNALFTLTTSDPAVEDQLWDVSLVDAQGDDVAFDTAIIQFQYDDTAFAPGFDENQLGIWHFDSDLGVWESFNILDGTTTIDTAANVITIELSNFSEVQLGVFAVPEPSTITLAGLGLAALGVTALRRRRRAA